MFQRSVIPLSLFYPADGGSRFLSNTADYLQMSITQQKTVMFITTAMTASFHAYIVYLR
jgi:hypothetical protein